MQVVEGRVDRGRRGSPRRRGCRRGSRCAGPGRAVRGGCRSRGPIRRSSRSAAPPPSAPTARPRTWPRAARRRRGSRSPPPRRPRSRFVAGSLTKTSEPAGAATVSPSSVNVARPERTRYSSSCPPAPGPSSSCSPMISWPASVARHALIPNDSIPSMDRIMCQRGRPSSAYPSTSSSRMTRNRRSCPLRRRLAQRRRARQGRCGRCRRRAPRGSRCRPSPRAMAMAERGEPLVDLGAAARRRPRSTPPAASCRSTSGGAR